jgi:GTP1/Obg family GTP-binding protein
MTTIETIVTIVSALGGFELIKWFYTRKSKAKVEEAEAEVARIKADADEYHLIRERLDLLNKDMIEKEKRFMEQTNHVRELNRQLIDKEVEIGNYKAEISALKAERQMKLCERRGCQQRQPQSGY